ncbi:MAG TPA: 3-hydroxyacyl-CoA dehydrogenase NAD-binding domain-containing protein, partial [Xanthobacteraceae bacterium]|nr:3-hydroxyacyl-CoA dehydrogenase NAD-binding domain-containing protein [Xanthobacteraceae bacterium]
MAVEIAKARIAIVGAGLMGHGIAQVFALAGHDVTITDSFAKNLETVQSRIAANLKDLGDDPSAVDRVTPKTDLAEAVRDAELADDAVRDRPPLEGDAVHLLVGVLDPLLDGRGDLVRLAVAPGDRPLGVA